MTVYRATAHTEIDAPQPGHPGAVVELTWSTEATAFHSPESTEPNGIELELGDVECWGAVLHLDDGTSMALMDDPWEWFALADMPPEIAHEVLHDLRCDVYDAYVTEDPAPNVRVITPEPPREQCPITGAWERWDGYPR